MTSEQQTGITGRCYYTVSSYSLPQTNCKLKRKTLVIPDKRHRRNIFAQLIFTIGNEGRASDKVNVFSNKRVRNTPCSVPKWKIHAQKNTNSAIPLNQGDISVNSS